MTTVTQQPAPTTAPRLRHVLGATLFLAGAAGTVLQPVWYLTNVPWQDLGLALTDVTSLLYAVIPIVMLVVGLAMVLPGSSPRTRGRLLTLGASVAVGAWILSFATGAMSAATLFVDPNGTWVGTWSQVSPVAVVTITMLPVLVVGPYLWLRFRCGRAGHARARQYLIDGVIAAGALGLVSAVLLPFTLVRPILLNLLFTGDPTVGSLTALRFLLLPSMASALIGVVFGGVAWWLAGRRYPGARAHIMMFVGGLSTMAVLIPSAWTSVTALQAFATFDASEWDEPVLPDDPDGEDWYIDGEAVDPSVEEWYLDGEGLDPDVPPELLDDPFAELDASGPDGVVDEDLLVDEGVVDLYTNPGSLLDASLGWQEYVLVALASLPQLAVVVLTFVVARRALGRLAPTLR
jgi:hypothetical protein